MGVEHKAGFVSILGNPNVGKSTLMNRLVGERLSIVTHKSQTTRHRIFGIVNHADYQIVYSDTPGILRPAYELQKAMLGAVESTLQDSDVLLYITDVVEQWDKHAEVLERVAGSPIPKVVVINKIDLSNQRELERLVAAWEQRFPGAAVFPVSALEGFGVEQVQAALIRLLPVAPKYYPEDQLTDRPTRFFVTEIVREKILQNCAEEVPYSVEVVVREYTEGETMDHIEAVVYVARDSQRGILIGRGGRMIRRIGTEARRDLEVFLDKRVFLRLLVQTKERWRDDAGALRNFGYIE
ncbi:MAG: GTPase Era [Bacteroidia bacterium]|nr:MAG: GTPase Era [Bacteroidia bacterium]